MWPFSTKQSISRSGLLSGSTDWHCHLLPGVDDGVRHASESLDILRRMEEQGVSEVYFTPHIMEDIPNRPSELKERFEEFRASYRGNIRLHLAAEHMLDPLFERRLQERDVLPLTAEGLLLVETSYFNPPMDMDGMLERVREQGYTPVLAHPERYVYMDENRYRRLHDTGIRFQLNLPSLAGAYGIEAKEKAEWLLNKGWYHLTGTDTHSLRAYQFFLQGRIGKKTLDGIRYLK